jgi:hypothetical protein
MFSDQEKYVNLGTFKRSGEQINTPLWFMKLPDSESSIYSITNHDMVKVKRVRNFPDVKVARCDFRGNIKGEWRDAVAHVVEDQELYERVFKAQRKKYGWQVAMVELIEKVSRKHKRRVVIKISTPAAAV